MQMETVLDRIDGFENITEERALEAELQTILHECGISSFSFGETGPILTSERLNVGDFPSEWMERYFNKAYWRDDPIHFASRSATKPFNWHFPGKVLTDQGKTIMDEAASFGVCDGFTVPICHQNGYRSGISFLGEGLAGEPMTRSVLNLVAIYFHGNLLRIREAAPFVPEAHILTPRERECLQWAALGKTDWEIGELLSISNKTAHAHIENAKRKFGVHTRVQAVVAGLRNGTISY